MHEKQFFSENRKYAFGKCPLIPLSCQSLAGNRIQLSWLKRVSWIFFSELQALGQLETLWGPLESIRKGQREGGGAAGAMRTAAEGDIDRQDLWLWRVQRFAGICPGREEEIPWVLFPPTLRLLLVLPID